VRAEFGLCKCRRPEQPKFKSRQEIAMSVTNDAGHELEQEHIELGTFVDEEDVLSKQDHVKAALLEIKAKDVDDTKRRLVERRA
jgi:hypothetical protein